MSSKSPNEAPSQLPDRVLVGRVRRPHGVRGEILVEVLSDAPERFAPGADLLAVAGSGPARPLTIAACRSHPHGALLRLRGVVDRDAAEDLAGARLEAERRTSPEPPPGSYYYFELAGCRCLDSAHGELGVVTEVVEDGGGLLLEVSKAGRTLLVPFVDEYLEEVDVAARRIALRLPAGLVDACTSAS